MAFSVRNSETSTRSSESFQGSLGPGLDAGLQRSQPGFFRRRFVVYRTDAIRLRAGDLEAWSDDPLVEGNSRGTGAPALDEASSIAFGSGLRANGLEGSSRLDGIEVRSRWQEDRTRDGGTRGSGAVHLEVGDWTASVRSQTDGARAFSSGWSRGPVRAWAATTDNFRSAVLLRADSGRSGSGLSGSARWISGGFRHDGLPPGWTGSAAADLAGRLAFDERVATSLRIQVVSDSSDRIRSRATSGSRVGFSSGIDLGLVGACTLDTARVWSSARIRIGRSKGAVRPWIEHSWNDSGSTQSHASALGFAWSSRSRTLRGRVDRDWRSSKTSALVSQEVAADLQRYRLGLRLEVGQNLVTQAVRGQGTVSCDW